MDGFRWGHLGNQFPCAWQGWVLKCLETWLALPCGGGAFLAPRSIGLYAAYAIAILPIFYNRASSKAQPESPRGVGDDI